MKPSEVYLKAAKYVIKNHTWSCLAIENILNYSRFEWSKEARIYRRLFSPDMHLDYPSFWFGATCSEEEQFERSIALLFMAEIAKESEE